MTIPSSSTHNRRYHIPWTLDVYLLDANVWIALLRGKSPLVEARFRAATAAAEVRVCSVVVAELR
jgi:predicted nucleic acid-binding protein